ncbi:hypothetical protein BLNAU_21961 [Blattamonas nauphoetae]|uniref:Uncharacterized protein n=1 Tax=Blattamonas nauphoetae TaxID=2049346 RepID=A0ABQ9WVH6_9EUKA|nr:hypothetical protein BLNAU_21961 [Blattamonas nauphoetae]
MKAVAFDRLDRSVVSISHQFALTRALSHTPSSPDSHQLSNPLFHISPVLARAEVKFNNPPFIVVANSDRDQRLVVSGSKAKKHTLSQDGEKLRALSEVEGRCVFIVNQAGVIERKLKLNRFGAAASRRGATSERREEQKRQAEMLAKRDPVALSKATQKVCSLLTPPDMSGPSYRASGSEDSDDAGRWEEGQSGHCSVRFGCCPEVSSEQETTDRAGTGAAGEEDLDRTADRRDHPAAVGVANERDRTNDKAKADLRDLRMALITTKECGIKLIGEDKTLVREAGERILIAATKQEKTKKNDPNTEMENAAAAQEEEYEAWEREGERALPALQADLDSLLSEYNTLRLRIVQTKGQ